MKRLPLLLFAFLPLCIQAKDNRPNDHAQWQGEIAAFETQDRTQPPPRAPVLFIGSSSIRKWTTLTTDFPGYAVLNRGFGGSEVDDSTFYADRIVSPYHARAIVMYAGDNDLQDNDSPQTVRDEFAAFVRKARAYDAAVPIAFIAIKPSVARARLQPQIEEANALVKAYAATQKNVTYVDVYTPMLGQDGKPQSKWFVEDGLHMNRSGYELWIRLLKPWMDAHGR